MCTEKEGPAKAKAQNLNHDGECEDLQSGLYLQTAKDDEGSKKTSADKVGGGHMSILHVILSSLAPRLSVMDGHRKTLCRELK